MEPVKSCRNINTVERLIALSFNVLELYYNQLYAKKQKHLWKTVMNDYQLQQWWGECSGFGFLNLLCIHTRRIATFFFLFTWSRRSSKFWICSSPALENKSPTSSVINLEELSQQTFPQHFQKYGITSPQPNLFRFFSQI